ncbi:TAM domain methyltransferase [Rasamsonia emersonii CBS 393.64]|uniref:TAM domain methyltransferase n=1 Tax=Rasamsonia emersonii (strain ATCC 16479 / CBS 393.64 / IMI 116815) TaxID=1408163 RepID=A0A0F4YV48_RASE3|nr:TAM domain methyltransferase [Rasamsonia emersonii CBS 393.64]KKA22137.1 TAM domain methyltransferase [Rasamsonia emersonii CBS 393.64]
MPENPSSRSGLEVDLEHQKLQVTHSHLVRDSQNGRRYHAFREGAYTLMKFSEYPSAQIIGTDLSPIQPQWVPPNCTFEIDDYETEWVYTRPFDFIHGRELAGFVADYGRLFSRAFKHLKPGGYFEIQTVNPTVFSDDDSLEKAKNLRHWVAEMHKASEQFGKSMTVVETWKDELIKAGFEDVHREVIKFPIGPWAKDKKLKEIGKYHQAQVIDAIGSYTPALFTRILGYTREEAEVLCVAVRNEIRDRTLHLYQEAHFVYGRKPEAKS